MRKSLDTLYSGAAILAGLCLVGIAALVLVQIGGRLSGVFIRGIDQIVGYLLAASTFLALAYTFATGGHVRVELVLEMLPAALRRRFELACLLGAAALVGYFAWHSVAMTWQSYVFKDVTVGLIAMPLWIPQSVMAVGLCILFLAVLDALVLSVRGCRPSYLTPPPEGVRS